MNENNRIRVAVQKSGRLSEESLRLLTNCGIRLRPQKEELICQSDNFPLDLLRVRDDDIPGLIADGSCDFGIIGTNVLQEKSLQNGEKSRITHEIIEYLGFALCRLSISVPKNFPYQDIRCLEKCRIATSYPHLLSLFLKQYKLNIKITTLTGSVEIAPRLGIAEGICDLVSTGATLEANNLREVETIFKSQAVLIKSPNLLNPEKKIVSDFLQNKIKQFKKTNKTMS